MSINQERKEISIAYMGQGEYEIAMFRGDEMFSNSVVKFSRIQAFKQAVKWHRRYGYAVRFNDGQSRLPALMRKAKVQ